MNLWKIFESTRMETLIDTHALLWAAGNDARLSRKAAKILEDRKNVILVSSAVIWEAAIKASLKKLSFPGNSFDAFVSGLIEAGYELLSVTPGHSAKVFSLPFHHRDPFDRLLAAQCLVEGYPIISTDRSFDKYGVKRIW